MFSNQSWADSRPAFAVDDSLFWQVRLSSQCSCTYTCTCTLNSAQPREYLSTHNPAVFTSTPPSSTSTSSPPPGSSTCGPLLAAKWQLLASVWPAPSAAGGQGWQKSHRDFDFNYMIDEHTQGVNGFPPKDARTSKDSIWSQQQWGPLYL